MDDVFFPDPGWLQPLPPGSPLEAEWNTFCRELPRLIKEGHEGRCVLIKGDKVVGVWDSRDAARAVGYERFGLVPFLAQDIVRYERPVRAGNSWRCLS